LAEHRSDSGVADSPAPQGRALHKKHFATSFGQYVIGVKPNTENIYGVTFQYQHLADVGFVENLTEQ
ncbi:MAG: hypothetical protein NZ529_01650, partial [Cytophagaceae bacterium]|nr:hypothetical protein [Cytophagaceae bacterium]MDW8455471.1 hypothetical protein [Cytophagaceae bacterium]